MEIEVRERKPATWNRDRGSGAVSGIKNSLIKNSKNISEYCF
jgi:hypothetical protein